jgi:hypothetical protein
MCESFYEAYIVCHWSAWPQLANMGERIQLMLGDASEITGVAEKSIREAPRGERDRAFRMSSADAVKPRHPSSNFDRDGSEIRFKKAVSATRAATLRERRPMSTTFFP